MPQTYIRGRSTSMGNEHITGCILTTPKKAKERTRVWTIFAANVTSNHLVLCVEFRDRGKPVDIQSETFTRLA